MSERQHPVAECWWHCGKGWHRYLICIIIFAQGREFFWTPHYHLSWDFFNYYYYNYYYYYFRSEEEEDRNPGFAGRVFPSTHVVFISLAFVFGCSPFPCPHLPAAKPRTPPGAALLPPPLPSALLPSPHLAELGAAGTAWRTCDHFTCFKAKKKKEQLKLETTASPRWGGVQSMSCCCFPGAPASGSDRGRSRLHGVLGLLRACCYSFGGFLFVFFWVFGFFFFSFFL